MNSLAPTTTLQPPRPGGRSRFSKALPAPPPGMDDDEPDPAAAAYTPRELPPFPFPPRKDSVTAATKNTRRNSETSNSSKSHSSHNSNSSVKTERFNFPLPPRPPEVPEQEEEPAVNVSQVLSPTRNMIPRRPVGQPATGPKSRSKSNRMKRVSSISSLLSAYSNSSTTDAVNRSSQETVITKDSEPAHSHPHEPLDSPKDLANILSAYSSNPYEDELSPASDNENTKTQEQSLPPLTIPGQPDMASKTQPKEAPAAPVVPAMASSPILGKNESPKQEIWRRRADSKSSLNITVPELKLPTSHGSTAAAAAAAAIQAAPAPMRPMPREQVPRPPPKKPDVPKSDITGLDALVSSQQGDAQQPNPDQFLKTTAAGTTPSQPAQTLQPSQPSQPLQPLPQKPLPQPLFPNGSDATAFPLPPSKKPQLGLRKPKSPPQIQEEQPATPEISPSISTDNTTKEEPNTTPKMTRTPWKERAASLSSKLSLPGRNVRPRKQTETEAGSQAREKTEAEVKAPAPTEDATIANRESDSQREKPAPPATVPVAVPAGAASDNAINSLPPEFPERTASRLEPPKPLNNRGLPSSPLSTRVDAQSQPSRSAATADAQQQQTTTGQMGLPRTPNTITRKQLASPPGGTIIPGAAATLTSSSGMAVQKTGPPMAPAAQPAVVAPSPSPLSLDASPKESDTPAMSQPAISKTAATAAMLNQPGPSPQQPNIVTTPPADNASGNNNFPAQGPTTGRRPDQFPAAPPVPASPMGGGGPPNRPPGLRPVRSQPSLYANPKAAGSNSSLHREPMPRPMQGRGPGGPGMGMRPSARAGSFGGGFVGAGGMPPPPRTQSRNRAASIQSNMTMPPQMEAPTAPSGYPAFAPQPSTAFTRVPGPFYGVAARQELHGVDLYDLVESLNNPSENPYRTNPTEDTESSPPPTAGGGAGPARPPLGNIREVSKLPEPEPPSTEELHAALSRLPQFAGQGGGSGYSLADPTAFAPGADGAIPARSLNERHRGCYARHATMVPSRNRHHALACQTCGPSSGSSDGGPRPPWRKVCAWCALRVCDDCAGLLARHGGDLDKVVEAVGARKRVEKGKARQEGGASTQK